MRRLLAFIKQSQRHRGLWASQARVLTSPMRILPANLSSKAVSRKVNGQNQQLDTGLMVRTIDRHGDAPEMEVVRHGKGGTSHFLSLQHNVTVVKFKCTLYIRFCEVICPKVEEGKFLEQPN